MPVFCHVKKYANCEPAWKAKYNGGRDSGIPMTETDYLQARKGVLELDHDQNQQENWFDPNDPK